MVHIAALFKLSKSAQVSGIKITAKNLSNVKSECVYLPARASEQGNVIGSVRIYIYVTGHGKRAHFAHNMLFQYKRF